VLWPVSWPLDSKCKTFILILRKTFTWLISKFWHCVAMLRNCEKCSWQSDVFSYIYTFLKCLPAFQLCDSQNWSPRAASTSSLGLTSFVNRNDRDPSQQIRPPLSCSCFAKAALFCSSEMRAYFRGCCQYRDAASCGSECALVHTGDIEMSACTLWSIEAVFALHRADRES